MNIILCVMSVQRLHDYFGFAWIFESFCLSEENFPSKYDKESFLGKAQALPINNSVPEIQQ